MIVPPPSILFVCLGNICRSPLAEGALRNALNARGLDWTVDSAGTGHWHIGSPPDPRAIRVAAAHGADIAGLRGRQVDVGDLVRFDLVLAMDHDNLRLLRQLAPAENLSHVALALDLVPGREGEAVADPYYGDQDGFLQTWRDATAIAEALIARWIADAGMSNG
ncbi:low molecular weight protein-tyrosine-phosphatase [Blastomonas sp.]|uniref:low molecular weight protein-tyrosine-phosphatase n=1 Tax=Blastomonas sp. TaxID=1909299 RepID=UPI003593854F